MPLVVLPDDSPGTAFGTDSRLASQNLDRSPPKSPVSGYGDDIIAKGLVTLEETHVLLGIFQEHYARWVSFDKMSPTVVVLDKVRKSPLLLAACCLIAVRYVRIS